MRYFAALLVFAVCLASTPPKAADQLLTFTGLGPVRIGMSVTEAEKALGAALKPLDKSDGVSREICWLTERADGSTPWITYMVQNQRIVRIDVWQGDHAVPPVATGAGIKIGSTEQAILEKYRTGLQPRFHPNLDPIGGYAIVRSEDGRHGLVFETAHGSLVNMRGGLIDPIQLMETCL